jgi:diacylglycerol kinase (ATP)
VFVAQQCKLAFSARMLTMKLIVEILNSAVESVVDRIGDEYHVLSGAAKDMGAAAVWLSLMLIIMTWLIILV